MAELPQNFSPHIHYQPGDLIAESIIEAIKPVLSSAHKGGCSVWYAGNVLVTLGAALMATDGEQKKETLMILRRFHSLAEKGELHDYFFSGSEEQCRF